MAKIFGTKVGTTGSFCREIFSAVFFPARNLENQKIFRLNVENSKKIRCESWKKADTICMT